MAVAADDRCRLFADDLVLPARRQSGADAPRPSQITRALRLRAFAPQGRPKARIAPPRAVIYLFGASELAFDRLAAMECRAASAGGLRPQAPVIDRQEKQQHRHRVGKNSRNDEEDARQHLASAVEQAAQKGLLAMECRDRVAAKGEALVPQQPKARDERSREPDPQRDTSPSREPSGHVKIEEGEYQYNSEQDETHGELLDGRGDRRADEPARSGHRAGARAEACRRAARRMCQRRGERRINLSLARPDRKRK